MYPSRLPPQWAGEKWRQIPENRGYMVSSDGRVWSLKSQQMIKQRIDRYGYKGFILHGFGKNKSVRTHRMVASAFIANPEGKPYVNHINGIKLDCRSLNLEWVTHQENMAHAHDEGLMPSQKGDNNPRSKIDEFTARRIKKLALEGKVHQKKIAEMFGISQNQVSKIKTGAAWGHLIIEEAA